MTIGSDYDPMLAKIIVHADDRAAALSGLDRALSDTAVLGVETNIDFLRFVLADKDVRDGRLDTELLARLSYIPPDTDDEAFIAAAAYRWLRCWPTESAGIWDAPTGWRMGEHAGWTVRLRGEGRTDHVHVVGTPQRAQVWVEDGKRRLLSAEMVGDRMALTLDGIRVEFVVAESGHQIWLAGELGTVMFEEVREASARPDDEHEGDADIVSPMPGSVVALGVDDKATVAAGDVVVAVEAMKMEHSLRSPVDGVVQLLVGLGEQVKVGQVLARITASTPEHQQQ